MARMTWDQRRENLGGSLWFYPLVLTLGAMVLGAVLGQIDEVPDGPLDTIAFHGGPEEARRILITVASATIGVFAVIIGLTLVALQVAGSRYSPRLVRSILRDRPTQLVAAMFIATFAYNAAGLYTISGTQPGDPYPRLAVTVGLVMLFVCIAALVYYVDRIAHTIQLHRLLSLITAGARRAVIARPVGIGREAGLTVRPVSPATAVRLVADRTGYVQRLRVEGIVKAAAADDVVVELAVGIGDQVVRRSTLGWVWRVDEAPLKVNPRLRRAIDQGMTIGAGRSTHSDVALSAIEMVDIALVSLHIFDYHTVEQSCAELGVMVANLASQPLGDETYTCPGGVVRLVVPGRNFEDYLELACGEIRRKGAAEPVVLLSLVRLLKTVGTVADGDRRAAAREQLEMTRKAAVDAIHHQHDLDRVLSGIDDAKRAITDADRRSVRGIAA